MNPLIFILRAESSLLRFVINLLFLIAFVGAALGYANVPAFKIALAAVIINLLMGCCKKIVVGDEVIDPDLYVLRLYQTIGIVGFGVLSFDTFWNDNFHLSILYGIVFGLTGLARVWNLTLVIQTISISLSLTIVCIFLIPVEFPAVGGVEIFALIGTALFWGMLYQEERRLDYPVSQSTIKLVPLTLARSPFNYAKLRRHRSLMSKNKHSAWC